MADDTNSSPGRGAGNHKANEAVVKSTARTIALLKSLSRGPKK